MWEMPIFVITAYCGATMSASLAISPNWLMPISTTAASTVSSSWNIVSGTPIWLFWLPCVFMTRLPAERARATISFVVVFPTLPVMPTIGIENRARYALASACSAFSVSSTAIHAWVSCIAVCSCVKTAAAPASSVAEINRCASTRSPRIGTNKAPGSTWRLSVVTCVTCVFGSPQRSLPPQAFTISETVISISDSSYFHRILRTKTGAAEPAAPVSFGRILRVYIIDLHKFLTGYIIFLGL